MGPAGEEGGEAPSPPGTDGGTGRDGVGRLVGAGGVAKPVIKKPIRKGYT